MLVGVWSLIKLILRRDRIKLPVWVIGIAASLLAMIPLLRDMYGDPKELATLHGAFATNPAGIFLTGPMDGPTFGGLMTIETVLWWGLALAFMNTLLIVRHTRQNEEMGAQELILSGRAHRGSGLLAVLIVAIAANLLVALMLGIGMAGEDGWSAGGGWLYALSMGIFGVVWAAIAAVVAQFVESSRSANGILAGLIGLAFMLRGVGDFMGTIDGAGLIQPAWLSWLSPFGWMQATRSLTYPAWWPLIVSALFAAAMVCVAFWLLSKRDVGAGILPARKGRAHASAFLRLPIGLTWKLQKNVFVGWLVGTVAMVATIGVLVPEMSHVYETSPDAKALIESMGGTGAMIPSFLSAMLSITVVMVLAYTVQALGKLRSEEASGHLENLLATRLSRIKWLGMHGLVVVFGGAFMLVCSGVVLAATANSVSELRLNVGDYTLAALSYLPLLLLFVGLYTTLFGILPRAAGIIVWALFGYVAFMSWIGPMLKLDEWVLKLSPMAHIAVAPANEVEILPLIVMSVGAVVLVAIGLIGWRTRNLVER